MRILPPGGEDGGDAAQRGFQALDQGLERRPLGGGGSVLCVEEDQAAVREAKGARGIPRFLLA